MLLNNKQERAVDTISYPAIKNLATQLSLAVNEEQKKLAAAPEKDSFLDGTTYHWYKEITGTGIASYKVKVAFVAPSLSGDTDDVVAKVSEQIKTSDVLSGGSLVMNDWKTEEDIKNVVSGFNPLNSFEVYREANGTYIVYVVDTKDENQLVYNHVSVSDVPTDFMEQLTKRTEYDIAVTFVQDREPWVLAKTQNNKILNGAYFKFANPGVSQM